MGIWHWAVICLVGAIVAGGVGFRSVTRPTMGIARFFFGLFLIAFLILLILGLLMGKSWTPVSYVP